MSTPGAQRESLVRRVVRSLFRIRTKLLIAQMFLVLVPLAGLIDPKNEAARLGREIAKAVKDVERLQKQLGNESFIARAPKETVDIARDDLKNAEAKVKKLEEALAIVAEAEAEVES